MMELFNFFHCKAIVNACQEGLGTQSVGYFEPFGFIGAGSARFYVC